MKEKSIIALVFIVFSYGLISFDRNSLWLEGVYFYKDITVKSPNLTRGWTNYGSALMDAGRYNEAIGPLEVAVRLTSWNLSANYNLGVCYIKKGQYALALKYFESVTSINDTILRGGFGKTLFVKYELQSLSNLGNLYTTLGDLEKGILNFNRALEIKPDDISSIYNLAVAYKQNGMREESKREFEKVLMLNPSDSMARQQLELLYN